MKLLKLNCKTAQYEAPEAELQNFFFADERLTSQIRMHRIPLRTQEAYGKGRALGRHSRMLGHQKFFTDVSNLKLMVQR